MAKSTHETKTFEKLQEQVERYSGLKLEAYPQGLYSRKNEWDANAYAVLSGKEAAIVDLVRAIESNGFTVRNAVKVFDMMRYWFMAHNSKAYMTLLD